MSTLVEADIKGEVYFTRQQDWYDPMKHPHSHVTIVGCGGIGSFAALALAKLGIARLTLIDFDTVEAHNIPNQMLAADNRGEQKVLDVASTVAAFAPTCDVRPYSAKLTENGWEGDAPRRLSGVVISAVDSMWARELVWKQCRLNLATPLLLDGRLDAENIVVYAADPRNLDDIHGYEATLHSDEEARVSSCTRQSIIDVGFAVASILTRQVRRHFARETLERMVVLDQAGLNYYKSEEWIG